MSSNPYYRVEPLQRVMAESYASDFCEKNNLSTEKLRSQRFQVIEDTMVFAQPTSNKPKGLTNDIATQPYPTLVIRLDKQGNVFVEKTQYTDIYLSK